MKQITLFLLSILIFWDKAHSQNIRTEGIQYSQPLQIDSSLRTYVIGILPNKTNKDKYLANIPLYEYVSNNQTIWTNIIFYNYVTKQASKLFSKNELVAIFPILPFYNGITSYSNQNLSISFSKFILLSIKMDYNEDGFIDEKDPVSLFICSKTGSNLKQLNPQGTNTIAWSLSMDSKTIIAKIEFDKNSDKRFNNEDQILYQFDLDNEFEKIKTTQIIVN